VQERNKPPQQVFPFSVEAVFHLGCCSCRILFSGNDIGRELNRFALTAAVESYFSENDIGRELNRFVPTAAVESYFPGNDIKEGVVILL